METLQEKKKKIEQALATFETQIIATQNNLNALESLRQQAIGKINLINQLMAEEKK